MIHQPFNPAYGSNQVFTPAAASSAAIAIDAAMRSKQVRLANSGANICYVRIGESDVAAATAADLPVRSGETVVISKPQPHTHIRHISAAGTTLNVMLGEGGF